LMTAHPDALATVNRWKHTPIHSLFEYKYSRREMTDNPSIIVETLLEIWGGGSTTTNNTNKLDQLFASHAEPNNPISNEQRTRIDSALRRSLRARDSEDKLPLHRAAECVRCDERALRALVAAFRCSFRTEGGTVGDERRRRRSVGMMRIAMPFYPRGRTGTTVRSTANAAGTTRLRDCFRRREDTTEGIWRCTSSTDVSSPRCAAPHMHGGKLAPSAIPMTSGPVVPARRTLRYS